jgi:hypothetical protein
LSAVPSLFLRALARPWRKDLMTDEKKAERADKSTESEERIDADSPKDRPREIGGRQGPDPTRYGDWEKNGRCIDF